MHGRLLHFTGTASIDEISIMLESTSNILVACFDFVLIDWTAHQRSFRASSWSSLDPFHTWSEQSVGVFLRSFTLPLTSVSALPKIKPGPTLEPKTNKLLKCIVSCLHGRCEFPSQLVRACVCRGRPLPRASGVIDQCYSENSSLVNL